MSVHKAQPRVRGTSRKRTNLHANSSSESRSLAHLPLEGFVRERTVVTFFATSHSTLWRWITEGRFPKPIKLGPGTTAWDVRDLRAHVDKVRNK